MLFELIGYISYSVTYYYSTPTHIDDFSSNFTGLGYFFSMTAILFVTYVIFFSGYQGTNFQLAELMFLTWIAGINAVYNGITFDNSLVNGLILTRYDPLGTLFIFIFYIFVMYIWVKRFLQLIKVHNLKESSKRSTAELFIFIVIASIVVLLYLLIVVLFDLIPDYSFFSSGIVTLFGIGLLVRNAAFLFTTDVNLDSIILIEKISGVRLYSKTFSGVDNGSDNSDFISSVISTINVSFSDTIRSHRDLREMNFSNKTVLIYSGDIVRSIVIVSSSNLITKGVSRYLVKKFEKQFGEYIKEKLDKNEFVSKTHDYREFDKEILYVRKFIPL